MLHRRVPRVPAGSTGLPTRGTESTGSTGPPTVYAVHEVRRFTGPLSGLGPQVARRAGSGQAGRADEGRSCWRRTAGGGGQADGWAGGRVVRVERRRAAGAGKSAKRAGGGWLGERPDGGRRANAERAGSMRFAGSFTGSTGRVHVGGARCAPDIFPLQRMVQKMGSARRCSLSCRNLRRRKRSALCGAWARWLGCGWGCGRAQESISWLYGAVQTLEDYRLASSSVCVAPSDMSGAS